MEQNPQPLQIEIDENVARGVYTNLALITHSETELLIDFLFLQPQTPKTQGADADRDVSDARQALPGRAAGQHRQVRGPLRHDQRRRDPRPDRARRLPVVA